ncbi:F-box/kelch-repeat protein [Hirschfeldia incana]|nr:F-box/kelch-repeat protein [Hirschfeldia incana]KAJ0255797.1 F-box/kelch-repeat protein [Hirschfeldia incana]
MLEAPSYLVSRDLPSSCQEESMLIYNAHYILQLYLKKRLLEDDDDTHQEASFTSKTLADELKKVMDIILIAQTYQRSNQSHQQGGGGGDQQSSPVTLLDHNALLNCLAHCSLSDFKSIASTNRTFRSLIKDSELYRLRRAKGIVEHWIYFSCRLLEWEAYDPNGDRWLRVPKMTFNECFMCSDKESLAVGTELLVFGKEIMSHVIYRYSILTNTWTSGMQMNTPRCLFGSASLGEVAVIAGGCDPSGKILNSAEVYNSETGEWTIIPSMNKARKMCSSVFMDGNFYVIGGIGEGNSKMLMCGEVYDLKKRTWTLIPNMLPERSNGGGGGGGQGKEASSSSAMAASAAPPLVAVVKDELYAANYEQQEVRRYNKMSNVWNKVGNLPERASSMNGWGLAFRACGDQLVVVGGPRALGGGFIEINACVPREGETLHWRVLASKPSGSFVYNCAVMGC